MSYGATDVSIKATIDFGEEGNTGRGIGDKKSGSSGRETAGAGMGREGGDTHGKGTLLSEALICAAMKNLQIRDIRDKGNAEVDIPPEPGSNDLVPARFGLEEKLLIEQTRTALSQRIDPKKYLVTIDHGVVMETLSGMQAMLKYEDLRLNGAKAILLVPGQEFILDHQGKPRLIEEIMKDIKEEMAVVLDQLCD